ncbi:hypothetical protein OQA88_11114 [Cercophora sp. LCS_1]
MDKILDANYERVERALTTLIDSISKYNPSPQHTEDLIAADLELRTGLSQLQQHQNNYQRILQLRQETAALDAQAKQIVGTLWSMRKEVRNTQTTVYPSTAPKYQFTTAELLAYARRISSTTLPPPGVTNGIDFGASPQPTTQDGGVDSASASFNNGGGVGTPGGTTTAAPTPSANGGEMVSQTSATELPVHLKQHANVHEGAVFYPWPVEDNVRGGGMAGYQQLLDSGTEPRGYDPEEEERKKQEEEQARKDAEERERLERVEADRRMREERERMARERMERERQEEQRRGSVATGAARAQKQQFTFLDGLDDDDDE